MTGAVRLIPPVLLGLMVVIGVAAVGGRFAQGQPAESFARREIINMVVLAGLPVLMAGGLMLVRWYISRPNPRMAEDLRRYTEVSLIATFMTATAFQLWQAMTFLSGPFDNRMFIRFLAAWIGITLAIRGNFMAKAGPPSGEGAPAPAAFLRGMRRLGFSVVLIGAALVVSALTLPVKFVAFAMVTAALLLVAASGQQRRMAGGAHG